MNLFYPQKVYISIKDINDNCPVFRDKFYSGSIPESAQAGTDIIDIIAEDADTGINGAIKFEITPGSGNPPCELYCLWFWFLVWFGFI